MLFIIWKNKRKRKHFEDTHEVSRLEALAIREWIYFFD
jgi:hypothetical protein